MSALGTHTPQQWAHDFLTEGRFPVTVENLRAVVSWEFAESGNPPNAAKYNPLNTTQRMPGSWDFNWNGGYPVQNYPDYQTGITANAHVIRNGYYPHVVAALEAGHDAQAVVNAIVLSPWGTRHITLIGAAPVPTPTPKPVPVHRNAEEHIVFYLPGQSATTWRPIGVSCLNGTIFVWNATANPFKEGKLTPFGDAHVLTDLGLASGETIVGVSDRTPTGTQCPPAAPIEFTTNLHGSGQPRHILHRR